MAPTARIAALGGALMLALVLSACGGGENASTTGAEAPPRLPPR